MEYVYDSARDDHNAPTQGQIDRRNQEIREKQKQMRPEAHQKERGKG